MLMVCCGVNFLSSFWEHSTLILMGSHMEASIHRYCADTGMCFNFMSEHDNGVECTETLCICIKLTCYEYDEGRVIRYSMYPPPPQNCLATNSYYYHMEGLATIFMPPQHSHSSSCWNTLSS
jgi:hypothetical protein